MFRTRQLRTPEVVRVPRRRQIDVSYMLITARDKFGPFKSEQQAVMFAAIRWPKQVPAWHIERRSEKR